MIHARIQHHPARAHLIPALIERLSPLPVEVVEHQSVPPSPWAGYQRCLTDPPDCTHLLIVQDDAVPCENAVPALHQIGAANPHTPVCLFLARLPRDAFVNACKAMKMNRRYTSLGLRSFMPVVAVLWPRQAAADFLDWADAHPTLPGQREPRSDDAMAGRWKLITRREVRVCVPSVFDHPDEEPSLIHTHRELDRKRRRANGKRPDSGRTAAYLADDATAYDWSRP